MADQEDEAPCPVCNKLVPLESINNHIDICLLPEGERGEQNSGLTSSRRSDESARPITARSSTSSSLFKVSPLSRSQHVQSTLRKRDSPSTSPAETSSKQSHLQFGESAARQLSSQCMPPPTKARKLTGSLVSCGQNLTSANTATNAKQPSIEGSSESAATEEKVAGPIPELTMPLAEAIRPTTIEDYVGQESVMGKNAILRTILESGNVPSLIFWGPPGCGKTTLARIIAKVAHHKCNTKFVPLSATTAGVKDVKEIVKIAKNEKIMLKRNTLLFIDEIHRFNKLQQDAFLPHVEDGTITLLGATTENPSFQLNSALLSRCRVIVLEKLQSNDIEQLLRRALAKLGAEERLSGGKGNTKQPDNQASTIFVEPEAITTLSLLCDGDARSALNGLELAVRAKRTRNPNVAQGHLQDVQRLSKEAEGSGQSSSQRVVTVEDVKESLQRTHLLYDRAGEEHYNIISALHKSMRGGDANASLYWLARMLCAGEDPLYVARRVVRFASEDIGLADTNALTQAVAAFQACHQIGMPECEVILAQAVVYMARAPKSVEIYMAYDKAKRCIKEHEGPLPSVPLHLRNAPTKLMKSLGYGKDYKYNPAFSEPVDQQYLPDALEGIDFFEFKKQ